MELWNWELTCFSDSVDTCSLPSVSQPLGLWQRADEMADPCPQAIHASLVSKVTTNP